MNRDAKENPMSATHTKGEATCPAQERTARQGATHTRSAKAGDGWDHHNPASAGMAGPELSVPRAHTPACVLSPDHYGFCFDDVAE